MRMPGFEAEASLSTGFWWKMGWSKYNVDSVESVVQPARGFPCRECDQICAGDLIGACMPWCLCACRGGTHCPLPS
jgi:hypothetical protein